MDISGPFGVFAGARSFVVFYAFLVCAIWVVGVLFRGVFRFVGLADGWLGCCACCWMVGGFLEGIFGDAGNFPIFVFRMGFLIVLEQCKVKDGEGIILLNIT